MCDGRGFHVPAHPFLREDELDRRAVDDDHRGADAVRGRAGRVDEFLTHQRGVEVEFKADVAPNLAGMMCARSFEDAFPARMEVRTLEPREVGPVWMGGDPRQVLRVGERKPVPEPLNPKPKKKA